MNIRDLCTQTAERQSADRLATSLLGFIGKLTLAGCVQQPPPRSFTPGLQLSGLTDHSVSHNGFN
jgi:hypothetical protein